MRKIIFLLSMILFSFPLTFAQLEDETNEDIVNDILTLYFQTIGQDKLLKTNTYVTKGVMFQGSTEITYTSYNKRPMNYRLEAKFPNMEVVTVFNGDSGWVINPLTGSSYAQPMEIDDIERSKLQADYDGMFYDYEKKGYTVEFIDKESVDFIEAYVLQLTTPNDDIITAYIDVEANVILKTTSHIMVDDAQEDYEVYYKDYKYVNNILMPYKIEMNVNGKLETRMVVSEITFNVEIPDSMFQMPGSSDMEQ
jgi:outer membrane lipoprotein-sorting protein